MLRLVTQLVLEADDDDSAPRFWQLVLAGASQRRAADPESPEGAGDPPDALARDD